MKTLMTPLQNGIYSIRYTLLRGEELTVHSVKRGSFPVDRDTQAWKDALTVLRRNLKLER